MNDNNRYPVYPQAHSVGDRGSQPYVMPLAVLHEFFSRYPANERIASVQVIAGGDEQVRVVVRLRASRLSQIARGLIEWQFTLSQDVVTVRRSDDGQAVQIEVTGIGDVGDIPMTVVGSPVFCRYCDFSVNVDVTSIEPGAEEQIDLKTLYRWALGFPIDTDNLPHQHADTDQTGDNAEDESAARPEP